MTNKMNGMTITKVCNIMREKSKWYKAKYDELSSTRELAKKQAKDTYRPSSPAYYSELERIEDEFAVGVSDAASDFSGACIDAVGKLREWEFQYTCGIERANMDIIRSIADIPVSAAEIRAIYEKYGTTSYFAGKLCREIALKNGIALKTGPSYDEKMRVLDELMRQVEEILVNYPADKDPGMRAKVHYLDLSDTVLERAQILYTGRDLRKTDEAIAQRLHMSILEKGSDMERARVLKNALENSSGDVRNLLLCRLASEIGVSDAVLQLSGHKEEVQEFRGGKAAMYANARSVVDRLEKATDADAARRIILENKDNEFLEGMIENARKGNPNLAELIPNKQDLPHDEWLKTLQDECLETMTGGAVKAGDGQGDNV